MLAAILIIISVSVLLSALTMLVLFLSGKCSSPEDLTQEEADAQYYDEDGNHLYYDRKLIARLKKQRAAEKK